jgi:hypothetical protein
VPVPRETLAGLRIQVAVPVAVTPRLTMPVKPPRGAMVIVEVAPDGPSGVETVVGLALRLIPGGGPAPTTVTEIAPVELVIALLVPPVPVILAVNVIVDGTVAVRAHVVEPVPPATSVTVEGVHDTASAGADTVEPIVTGPANCNPTAPMLVRVTPTCAVPPLLKVTVVEFDVIVNSLMSIVKVP